MRTRAILIVLAATGFVLGCGGDDTTGPPEPQPGELRVEIAGSTPIGGIVLTVTGTGITAPAASSGLQLYHDMSGNTLHAVVVGSSLSGTIMRFTVPDVRQVAGYQVSVQEASGTANQTLTASGVTLTIEP